MLISLEAIMAIVAVVVALPSTILVIESMIRRHYNPPATSIDIEAQVPISHIVTRVHDPSQAANHQTSGQNTQANTYRSICAMPKSITWPRHRKEPGSQTSPPARIRTSPTCEILPSPPQTCYSPHPPLRRSLSVPERPVQLAQRPDAQT